MVVSEETLATERQGVFAGGDVVTGPKTVLDAMGAGKLAAEMIDKHLRGETLRREHVLTRPSVYVPPVELAEEELEDGASGPPRAACRWPSGCSVLPKWSWGCRRKWPSAKPAAVCAATWKHATPSRPWSVCGERGGG